MFVNRKILAVIIGIVVLAIIFIQLEYGLSFDDKGDDTNNSERDDSNNMEGNDIPSNSENVENPGLAFKIIRIFLRNYPI
ncbi:MAG: hypothetical protein ACW99A_11430 [Candidatus Kariarchaeaceae archaeon]|jgi:hypothetical protein